eukprot:4874497-Alexandrium_andersonii.AAC.1
MSASLVGSEMCIRDRASHRPGFVRRGCVPARARHPMATNRAATEGAVSYTHLTLPTICSV